jgi:hypothetical protein
MWGDDSNDKLIPDKSMVDGLFWCFWTFRSNKVIIAISPVNEDTFTFLAFVMIVLKSKTVAFPTIAGNRFQY